MRPLPLACVLAAALAAGCSPRPTSVDDFTVLRDYGWSMPVAEPQASFNPVTNQVVARAPAGFAVLDEGRSRQSFYRGQSGRESWWPHWISDSQFVIGGRVNVDKLPDGRVVPPTEGLTVITLREDGSVRERQLARVGYRPKVWGDRIIAQIENKMWVFDARGDGEDIGEGFLPVPQRRGPGLAYQETPVIEKDWWTAKPTRGRLFVQWRRGRISEIPAAIEPSWTATGGIVATALVDDPPADRPWWEAGTRLVHLGDEGHRLETIAEGLRSPAAHPTKPVVAATDKDGRLVLVSLLDKRVRELAPVGDRPCWNHDGTRLLVEEPTPGTPNASHLRVYVFKIQEPKQ